MPIQFSCSQCHKQMQAPDGTEGKKARCPSCSAISVIPSLAAAAPVMTAATNPPPAPVSDNPFQAPVTTDFSPTPEQRERLGSYKPSWENEPTVGNYFKSLKEVLLSPKETFANLKRDGSLGRSIAFTAVGGVFMGVAVAVLQAIMLIFAAAAQGGGQAAMFVGMAVGMLVAGALIYPILAIIGCFIGGAILHVLLGLVGARKYDMNATIRGVAYMQMSSWPFMFVPILGPLIGSVWIFVVQLIGFAEIHETTKTKVFLAMILPIIFFIGIGIVVGVLSAAL